MPEVPRIYPPLPGAEALSSVEIIERFKNAETKLAIQKDGELTDISRSIFLDNYGIYIPPQDPNNRVLVDVSADDKYGFLYARNKDICSLVASGAVDMAIVGGDRLVEDQLEDQVEIVATLEEYGAWSIVFATPAQSKVASLDQISRVATKYPVISQRFFDTFDGINVEVLPVTGGAEIYPYLDYGEGGVDAIVDMTVSGTSLAAHNLVAWDPPIAEVRPLLIRKKEGLQ